MADKVQNSTDKSIYFCGVFLDLCKAFDTVDHTILLAKLDYYGIIGVANHWFVSYLNNRRQFVSLHAPNFDYQTITYGAPQGSVLGPLLFLLYVNDMPKSSSILEFHFFVDDTNLFLNDRSILNLETNLNIELKNVGHWLYANKLSLNIEKTSSVVFYSPQRRISHTMNFSISNMSVKSENKLNTYVSLLTLI